ncbi:hypothetical protein BDV24DRAFT_144342 [Aspergillus arachidicola]|uniref:Uncharacterized protein n=1 Tax=Aspergillus arachidicola TaxID=656916 RepID=A0A5N6XR47_9EURO|nr:hypothetical protein BDV24DRAFT_144342 [Aspergillus arachidicola]
MPVTQKRKRGLMVPDKQIPWNCEQHISWKRAQTNHSPDPIVLHDLGVYPIPEFLARPWKDRQRVYADILTLPHPLHLPDMVLWDDRGPTWADDLMLPRGARLLDSRQTGSDMLTREARECFYSQNTIVASGKMPWFHYRHEDEFDPARWLQRIHVVLWCVQGETDATSMMSMNRLHIDDILERLSSCDRLDYVVLELRGTKAEQISILESHLVQVEENLRHLDQRMSRGVLLIRECVWDLWDRCIRSQAIHLPWWDTEKITTMGQVEAEWRKQIQIQPPPAGSWETMGKAPVANWTTVELK